MLALLRLLLRCQLLLAYVMPLRYDAAAAAAAAGYAMAFVTMLFAAAAAICRRCRHQHADYSLPLA